MEELDKEFMNISGALASSKRSKDEEVEMKVNAIETSVDFIFRFQLLVMMILMQWSTLYPLKCEHSQLID